MKTDINWDGQKIQIRPSSIDAFYGCTFQWAKVFLEGYITIPNARAAIGTAVHKGVEEMWKEAMLRKSKESPNLSMMFDAAIEAFDEEDKKEGLMYEHGEDRDMAHELIKDGNRVFVEDIMPFSDIPDTVEEYLEMPLNHPVVEKIGGTVDYRVQRTMADLKTSKRKPVPQSYITQQTTYKLLNEANGNDIDECLIQGVTFTKDPVGHILPLEPHVPRTKFLINSMLDTLEAFSDGGDPKVLFRGNPKYYLCSEKYCTLYNNGCPYVNGA